MALIRCPECGKEVSDRAKACPYCGCPLEDMNPCGPVRIRIPNIELGTAGLFSSRRAVIRNAEGKILWEGKHGQTASFTVTQQTEVYIDLGGWVNPFHGTVQARKKYSCVQDLGIHLLATYRLAEVDVIDAD